MIELESEWKQELLTVYTEDELQVLDDLLMYAQFQFDVPFIESDYNVSRDKLDAVHGKLKNYSLKKVS